MLLVWSTLLPSQVKPDFFPEDITVHEAGLKCYCKPGINDKTRSKGLSLSYGWINSGTYVAEETTTFAAPASILDNFSHLEFKLKIPIVLKDRTKVLLGYKYYTEFYNFGRVGQDYAETFTELSQRNLKSNEYSLIISHSLNDKNYLGIRYKYATNGDYAGWTDFDSRYAIHNFMGVYGTKKSEDFEWGIGLIISSSFRRNTALPFLLYNRNFNKKWGIESLFPANLFLRYNVDAQTIGLFGIEYNSKSYRIDAENIANEVIDYAFNHSELIISFSAERHLRSWFWANMKIGYQNNFSSDFENKSTSAVFFQAEPGNGLYFRVGLFLSPTR